MPSGIPNVRRRSGFASGISGFTRMPSSQQAGRVSRLDASMWASEAGSVASTASWGLDVGVAPAKATRLVAAVSGMTTENMLVIGMLGVGGSRARLTMSIEIVAPALPLLRPFTNAPVTIFDSGWPAWGGVKVGERNTRAAVIGVPTVAGWRYRVWVNLEQAAAAAGIGSSAVSNCTYDFGPVFFDFTT